MEGKLIHPHTTVYLQRRKRHSLHPHFCLRSRGVQGIKRSASYQGIALVMPQSFFEIEAPL